jgi:hypothetical protein
MIVLPIAAGYLYQYVGWELEMVSLAGLCLLYSPILLVFAAKEAKELRRIQRAAESSDV